MKLNKLGNSDLLLSQIGMGTWAIGGGDWGMGWGDQDERESVQAIIEALEQGINWIDTAHAYGFGVSEEAVGKALREWKVDEIIVADSNSTDGTSEIAMELGAKVVHIPFNGYGDLRNQAISHCSKDWIFSLDSDERCTIEVRDEIMKLIDNAPLDIYHIPRRNFFMGRWIRFSGWYPNFRQPQLFKKGKMSYTTDQVHEGYISHSSKEVGKIKEIIKEAILEGKIPNNKNDALKLMKLTGKELGLKTNE